MKLNLTYRFDNDRLVYATYSEGFRVGGSNPLKAASVLPEDYSSDTLKNYEVGLKSEWLDNRLRFNIAAYYMDWENFAVQIEDPQPAIFQLGYVNLPSAEIPGVEAEFAATLSDNWQLDGAISWNDAQVVGVDRAVLRRGRRGQSARGARAGRRAAAADARLVRDPRHRVPVRRASGSMPSRSRASTSPTSANRSIRWRASGPPST